MDFSELHQFYNDISSRIGNVADQTSNLSRQLQTDITQLKAELHTTNILLTLFLIVNIIGLILNFFKRGKK
ncbi:hypothetical protein GQF01_12345 [Paenibacillus sp. 5J-6]|uniref:Uncharacterized protein n=1 Tax=Paenibacillus silvestris TaxID=2606219 RepID=A0A6L8UXU1_9BACL|nr:hypothetical protein [Paenibacillus silvestris]MZQ82895.1 hypothetical protein [Paenibacillus silvestris]